MNNHLNLSKVIPPTAVAAAPSNVSQSGVRALAPKVLPPRLPQPGTKELPKFPNIQLPPGMVLVRNQSGQILMIPQQTLDQMQAQMQAQGKPQNTMAPRPSTSTSSMTVKEGKIQPENLTSCLYQMLNSSPQPYLLPCLKTSLPAMRQLTPDPRAFILQSLSPATNTPAVGTTSSLTTSLTAPQPQSTTLEKTHVKKEDEMTNVTETTGNDPDSSVNGDSTPTCSSKSSLAGSVSRVEFLEAKIQWQDKLIKDLKKERDFLRAQIQGRKKKSSNHAKRLKLTVDDEDDDDSTEDGDDLPESSPNISDTSDSDTPRNEPRLPSSSSPRPTEHVHMKVEKPDDVIRRYEEVLKTFTRVQTLTKAFQINGVDKDTIKMTAPIAELKIVDPDTFNSMTFNPVSDTLLSFAKKCASHITPEKRLIIEDKKSRGEMLPLLVQY